MPKLKNNKKEKYLFGYQIDKENDNVFFNDKDHLYLDKKDGTKYISVTQLIDYYSNPFNASFFSKYKALEALADPDHFSLVKAGLLATQTWNDNLLEKLNIDKNIFNEKVEEIKKQWEDTKNEACEHGTMLHEIMETSFYGKSHFDLSNLECPDVVGNYRCEAGYYPSKLEDGIYPEYLVSWIAPNGLKICGQIDLLIVKDGEIILRDWKSNREIKKKSFFNSAKKKNVMMKFPLNNLMDCNFYHYALQLSLYAYMINQLNPDLKVRDLKIVHIDREGRQTIYPVEYLKSDVERMIRHYEREQKIRSELNRDKPFIV